MTKKQREICAKLSLALYGNPNAYRRLERRGIPVPQLEQHQIHGGTLKDKDGKVLTAPKIVYRRMQFTDAGVIELLAGELAKKQAAAKESEKKNEKDIPSGT